jgi:N-acetylglutamate synthase-like GNAT family acetyltransferase
MIENKAFYDEEELDKIYKLFNKYSKEVGFVLKPAVRESIKNKELLVYKQDGEIVGLCKFHKKKNKTITLYEIVVREDYKKKGIGSQLIKSLSNRGIIVLKCPIDNASNEFYKNYGFKHLGVLKGRKRNLNIWAYKK